MRPTAVLLRGRRWVDLLVLLSAVAAAAAYLLGAPPALRAAVMLLAICLVPGWPLVRWIPSLPATAAVGLTAALGLSVATLASIAMIWSAAWQPGAGAAALAAACVVACLPAASVREPRAPSPEGSPEGPPEGPPEGRRLRRPARPTAQRRDRHPAQTVLAVGALVTALGLWAASLRTTSVADLGQWGLLSELPVGWYAGLALVLLSTAALLGARSVRPRLLAAHAGVVICFLYGTAPAVESAPRYAYTYKHLGVVRYILDHGRVDPAIDIYQRWPGFFGLGALYTHLSGFSDPTRYAAWAEAFFSSVDAVLVLALATLVVRSTRTAWTVTFVFLTSNWVGQNYFAPQALAYVQLLAVWLLMVAFYRSAGGRLGSSVLRLVRWAVRAGAQVEPEPGSGAGSVGRPRAVAPVILLLFGALVATHQLTPYVLAGTVVVATLLGLLRSRWLPVAMVVMCVGYLVPNFAFINDNFGILSSLNPLVNVSEHVVTFGTPTPPKAVQERASLLIVLLIWLLALAGLVRHVRRGQSAAALLVAVPAFVPLVTLLGQSYGGEGRLRVFLYSLPFSAIGIGWLLMGTAPLLFTAARSQLRRTGAAAAVLLVLTALFLLPYLGREDLNLVTPDEVAASNWLYDFGRPGHVLMTAVPDFPARYGATYDKFLARNNGGTPNLLLGTDFGGRSLDPVTRADVRAVVEIMDSYASRGYLVFSSAQDRYARANSLFPGGGLQRLEAAVSVAPEFALVYRNAHASVYERR